MYKCIYCNSEDLSVSDIIPYALTGAKLTRKFVCHNHNRFTNDSFEKEAITHWDFFRSSLGLTERSGSDIKFNAEFRAGGVTIPQMAVSGRASIFADKNRLFRGEQNGQKVLVGNIEKLKQKNGVYEEDIKPLEMRDAVISVKLNLTQLLASKEMLCTVAKIAYEWHCYIHDIECYKSDKYQSIVECILLEKSIDDCVQICIDSVMERALATQCYPGCHGVYEYDDVDGYRYVVLFFWGVIPYKIRICRIDDFTRKSKENIYDLYLYGIDGEKSHTVFGVFGEPHLVSMSAVDAVYRYHKQFIIKLKQLMDTTVLSLAKVRDMFDDIKNALSTYKREPHDFALFVDYESVSRFHALSLLLLLEKNQNAYDFQKRFNENLKSLYNTQDQINVSDGEKGRFFSQLLRMHEEGRLVDSVERGLAFFDRIYEQEKSMPGP